MQQNKRIIIEGMDGSGKTTLVEHLWAQFTHVEVVVNKKGPDQEFNTWWPSVLNRDPAAPTPIHDRFFYSELVYGPVLRGYVAAEPSIVTSCEWLLRNTALLIYARPDWELLLTHVHDQEQMEGVHDHFDELLTAYDQLMKIEASWYRSRFYQYVWNREGEKERVTELVRGYLAGRFDV